MGKGLSVGFSRSVGDAPGLFCPDGTGGGTAMAGVCEDFVQGLMARMVGRQVGFLFLLILPTFS